MANKVHPECKMNDFHEQDEFGLFMNASNYQECRDAIIASKHLEDCKKLGKSLSEFASFWGIVKY